MSEVFCTHVVPEGVCGTRAQSASGAMQHFFQSEAGILRGMHYQAAPHEEVKLVRCTRGRIYDVIIDLREQSPTFKQYIAVTLTAQHHEMLYIPEGARSRFSNFRRQYRSVVPDVGILCSRLW